ncbi:MAG: hypothetical protein U9O94_10955 [Nanoarchaeota archaeon]|nr:hypothetical protein [Nanoarchaeota archaeon]
MEFTVKVLDDYKIMLIDNTRATYDDIPDTIYALKLDIISSKIPGGIVSEIDIMKYLRSNRIENELYLVDSFALGFEAVAVIPDGVYTFVLKVNNNHTVEEKIVVLNNIRKEIVELGDSLDYDEAVNDIMFDESTVLQDYYKYNYVIALYYNLIVNTSGNYDEDKINDLLDRLNRVLKII